MISAREQGFYQLLIVLQMALVSVLYWGCFLVVFFFYHHEVTFLQAYVTYWLVVQCAMILEAFSRPSLLRPSPGRMRWISQAVSRRQWIWIVGFLTGLLVFSQDLRMSRTFLGSFSVMVLVLLYFSNKHLVRWFAKCCSNRLDKLRLRTLILGPGHWCESIIPEIKTIHTMLQVVRIEVSDHDPRTAEEYATMVENQPIDLLIMPPRHLPDATVIGLMRLGDRLGFRCWLPIELTRTYGRRFHLQKVGRLDVLSPPAEPLETSSNQFIKRSFDLLFSTLVIVTVLGPLCLLVRLIHWRYSPGPLFFRQSRVGKNGMPFQVFKFRSLHCINPDESKQVGKRDSRIFKGGRFLRKFSIDEIPQFLNVFAGEMSVVGPRPHMAKHDAEFREIFERYGVRQYVKPGVTGLAQVKGFRGEIRKPRDLRNRARLDNFYVVFWSLTMDLQIVAMTLLAVVKPPKTAY